MYQKNPVELTHNELLFAFNLLGDDKENGRFVIKGESNFDKDFSRSQFHYCDVQGRVQAADPLVFEQFNTLRPAEKKALRKKILGSFFPENTENLQEKMVEAYNQGFPMLISHWCISSIKMDLFQAIFQPQSLSLGNEHSVKKVFSIKNNQAFLHMENTIRGCDCSIVADFCLNDEGFFELTKPIQLIGEDAEFIRALWLSDFCALDYFWPKGLDKSKFNAFIGDLQQQMSLSVKDINGWSQSLAGAHVNEEPLHSAIQNFFDAIQPLAKSAHLTQEQRLQLSEALHKTTMGLKNIRHVDWLSYIAISESFKTPDLTERKQFRRIVGAMLVIASLILCAGLIAVAVSSFGVAPPLVLGALVIAANLSVAIGATIAAVCTGIFAVGAGFFALSREKEERTGQVEKNMKAIVQALSAPVVIVDSSEEELELLAGKKVV